MIEPIDYQAIMRAAPDLYLVLSPDLKILDASDAYLQTTRVTREEIIGLYLSELFSSTSLNKILSDNQIEKIKSEFVSIVNHEFRTPLTSIFGAVSLLFNGQGQTEEKINSLLHIANSNCERLVQLINDFLDIDQLE